MGEALNLAILLTLKDEISGALKGVQSELEKTKGKAVNAKDVVNTMGVIGKTVLAAGMAVATSAVAGLGGAIAKLGMDAMPLEGVKRAFEGVSGAAEITLAKLREGSLGMVKDADLMKTYNNAAQLVSKTFADQLPDAMSYLSKVSAATGQDMGFMIDSLVKGVGRMSPMILDNLGIQVNLTEANERYAEGLGKSAKELTKSEQQAALMAEVLRKLKENTAAMPEVTGTAAHQFAVLKTTLENLKDRIGLAIVPALQSIAKTLVETLSKPEIRAALDSIVKAISTFAGKIAEIVPMLAKGDLQGALNKAFGPEIAGRIMGIVDSVSKFADKVAEFISEHAEELKGALAGIAVAFGVAAVASGIMAISIAPVTAVILAITAAAGVLGAAWAGNWGGIRDTLTSFWNNTASPIFEKIKAWLGENIPKAAAALTAFWNGTLLPAFRTVQEFIQEKVIPALQVAAQWLSEKLTEASKLLARFWEGTLKPAIETVWKFIQDQVIPLFEKLVEWLKDNIPVAIKALSDFWTNTLQPAIQAVWTFISGTLIPGFNTLAQWLRDTLAAAVQTLADFWNNKLKPALETVWQFIETYIIPIFKAIAEVYIAILNKALEALAGFWEKVLLPAIEKVWEFIDKSVIPLFKRLVSEGLEKIQDASDALSKFWNNTLKPALQAIGDYINDKLQPIFASLTDFVNNKLGPAIQWLKETLLDKLALSLDGVKNAAQWVINKINEFRDAINNLRLPDWLTPGSPTPFELGLWGIADAADYLAARSIPAMGSALSSAGYQALTLAANLASVTQQAIAAANAITSAIFAADVARSENGANGAVTGGQQQEFMAEGGEPIYGPDGSIIGYTDPSSGSGGGGGGEGPSEMGDGYYDTSGTWHQTIPQTPPEPGATPNYDSAGNIIGWNLPSSGYTPAEATPTYDPFLYDSAGNVIGLKPTATSSTSGTGGGARGGGGYSGGGGGGGGGGGSSSTTGPGSKTFDDLVLVLQAFVDALTGQAGGDLAAREAFVAWLSPYVQQAIRLEGARI